MDYTGRSIEILLVEDNRGDVRLTQKLFKDCRIRSNLSVVCDGVEAMEFLRKEGKYSGTVRPDLILLDHNLPRKDGREVLAEVKTNPSLKRIPVVVPTISKAEEDIARACDSHANRYITEPAILDQFIDVVKSIEDLLFSIVRHPSTDGR